MDLANESNPAFDAASMERNDTASTLESSFGSNLNTPADEAFEQLDGILRIRSSDFGDEPQTPEDDLKLQQAPESICIPPNSKDEELFTITAEDGLTRQPLPSGEFDISTALLNEMFSFDGPTNAIEHGASIIIKVLLFLPWCALVGGTILLCPKYLEYIAFRTGYVSSPSGIHRFAHWLEFAAVHVLSFLLLLGLAVWWNVCIGILIFSALAGQFLRIWSDVTVDPDIPLGHDDRQTMYILATKFFSDGCALGLDLLRIGPNYYSRQEGKATAGLHSKQE